MTALDAPDLMPHAVRSVAPPAGGLRVVSYGGGVQSTALLVLAAQGRIDYPVFLFSNVGNDSEHPATLDYVRDVAIPFGEAHGISVIELQRSLGRGPACEASGVRADDADRGNDGVSTCPLCSSRFEIAPGAEFPEHRPVETLWSRLMKPDSKSLPIPVRMQNGAPGNRSCTADFKIRVIGKWLKQHGASEENPATIGIGISTDEIERTNNRRTEPHEITHYPLIELGLDRSACAQVIRDAGLRVPPKSACFFCPFHRPDTWQTLAREQPVLFRKSVELEQVLTARRQAQRCPGEGLYPKEVLRGGGTTCEIHGEAIEGCDDRCEEEGRVSELEPLVDLSRLHGDTGTCPRCLMPQKVGADSRFPAHGKAPVFLSRFAKPLDEAIDDSQQAFSFDGPEGCDEGHCWT